MSIADHFDHAPDAGFVRSYDFRAARRQFQVSVALILILTFAAFSLGLLVRFERPAAAKPNSPPSAHEVHFAEGNDGVRLDAKAGDTR
jgi:hypothetical protein